MTTENDLAAVENNQGDNAGQEVNYNRVNFPHLIQRGVVGFQGTPGFQRWGHGLAEAFVQTAKKNDAVKQEA